MSHVPVPLQGTWCDPSVFVTMMFLNRIGLVMSDYEYERLLVMRWLCKYRMPNHGDYIEESFTFLKADKDDYITGKPKSIEHRVGMMVVSNKLISVSFLPDYTYNPYAENWFSNQNLYTSFFDESWIVAHSDNFDKIYKEVDKKIGIIIFDDHKMLAVVRQAVVRRGREMNHYALAGLLTKTAMVNLYVKNGDKQSLSESREMLRRHAHCVPYNKLILAVTNHLKEKHYNRLLLPF